MLATATVSHRWITPFSGIRTAPPLTSANPSLYRPLRLPTSSPQIDFKAYCTNKSQLPEVINSTSVTKEEINQNDDVGWLPAFPHILVASMSNFLFGFHIGLMNGPILSIAKELGFEGNSILEGFVVSIFIAGAFLGSAGAGYVVDKLGFRRTLQVDTLPLILGAILSAQANSLDQLLWGRFFVGLGIGANAVLVPIYISEVAPTKYRGSLGSVCQIGTCTGIIASLCLGVFSESDPHWWRTMLYIASVPGFIIASGMQFAVDSPRWLCKAGRLNDAKQVIANLWGPSEVEKSIEEFQSVLKNDGGDLDSSWSELLEEPHSRGVCFDWRFSICTATICWHQRGPLFFLVDFQRRWITNGALASLYVGLTNFAGALCALYLVDREGRLKLIIGSYLGMAIAMFLVVYAISFPIDEELRSNLSILGTILYMLTFAIGAGPVTGVIIPELSSSRTRGKIMSFSFSVHWVCNFLVGLFFLKLTEKFGVAPVYGSFGAVSILAALFSYSFLVETKGRSLEEIELSLNSNFAKRD
ncbi:putative major facilitator, sugar transporter, major facilitator superfamily [Helianthus annuus]|nr:putative major facilitator, sugar transporter, major facilitator superfamily [Helianthus annuus]